MSTKQTQNEVEEVKDLEQVEEVQDLAEAPEEVKEIKDAVEALVFREGLRDAADPNMIHKHLDNFLAMLCGETPVDSNVRTSTEYWLKRLATGEGGSTKKLYRHIIRFTGVAVKVVIVNDNNTQFTTTSLADFLKTALCTSTNSSYPSNVDVLVSSNPGAVEFVKGVYSQDGDQLRAGKVEVTLTIVDGVITPSITTRSSTVTVAGDDVVALN